MYNWCKTEKKKPHIVVQPNTQTEPHIFPYLYSTVHPVKYLVVSNRHTDPGWNYYSYLLNGENGHSTLQPWRQYIASCTYYFL